MGSQSIWTSTKVSAIRTPTLFLSVHQLNVTNGDSNARPAYSKKNVGPLTIPEKTFNLQENY